MILTQLACHPGASAQVLTALVTYATSPTCPAGDRDGLRTALAANPALPAASLEHLLATQPDLLTLVLARPDTTPQRALELLAHVGGRAPTWAWADALRTVRDPSGELPTAAAAGATGVRLLGLIVRSPTTPPAVRRDAVRRLAQTGRMTASSRAILERALATDPTLADVLAQVTTNARDTRTLAALLREDQVRRTQPVGSRSWLAAADIDTVLEHCAGKGQLVWARALDAHPDVDGRLAHAALARFPQTERILARVTAAAGASVADRHTAATAYARIHSARTRAPAPDPIARAVNALIPQGPVELAAAWAPLCRHEWLATTLVSRADLPASALDALGERFFTRARAYFTDPARATQLSADVSWGLTLATHPQARVDQRHTGADLVDCAAYELRYQTGAPQVLREAARVCLRLGAEPAAVVGADLPVAILREPLAARVPPLNALVAEAIGARLAGLGPLAVTDVLAHLESAFTGTVGQLLDTAATIAA